MRVAILGGTGFVGAHLVEALLGAGHEPSLLVRQGSEHKVPEAGACRIVRGDIRDDDSVRKAVDGADAVIYAIGILRESPQAGATFAALHVDGVERSLAAARKAGCGRFLLLSANGAAPNGPPYATTKYAGEQAVLNSGLEGWVFRPSVIFGDPRGRDEIASRLYRQMIRPPLPAVWFHTGAKPDPDTVRLSPVHVADVAAAFVAVLGGDAGAPTSGAGGGRTLTLGGAETLSFKGLVERIAKAVGRRKLLLPMPIALMSAAAAVGERIPAFPVTRDQLELLARGNVAPPDTLAELIGRSPAGFTPRELAYLPGAAGR